MVIFWVVYYWVYLITQFNLCSLIGIKTRHQIGQMPTLARDSVTELAAGWKIYILIYPNNKQKWTILILNTAFVPTPLGQCNAYVTCLVAQSAEELKESASNRAATWLRNYAAYEQSELLQVQQGSRGAFRGKKNQCRHVNRTFILHLANGNSPSDGSFNMF